MSFSKTVQFQMVIVALIYLTLTCTMEKYPIPIHVAFVGATISNTTIVVYHTYGVIITNASVKKRHYAIETK